MVLPIAKFKIGDKVKILPRGGKGKIIGRLRSPGSLYYSYNIKYKQRKNAKTLQDWFPERWIAKIVKEKKVSKYIRDEYGYKELTISERMKILRKRRKN